MATNQKKIRVDLALQGGGSHGAITWGVLDRLFEDSRIEVSGLSGTSAGAMNAIVTANGIAQGGLEGAREGLERFWRANSKAARFSPFKRSLRSRMTGQFTYADSPSFNFFNRLTRSFSPYDLNPFNINPLRELVEEQIDFDRVNANEKVKVYITATNVRTGRPKIFCQPHLSLDTVMASACLPNIYKTVMVDGEGYWDGGFVGNPALGPLVWDKTASDLIVIQLNPFRREKIPTTSDDIANRMNEITFNSALTKEMRSYLLLAKLEDEGLLNADNIGFVKNLHMIHSNADAEALDPSAKMNAEWEYLTLLRDMGRNWADTFLERNGDALGVRSTFDLSLYATDTLSFSEDGEQAMKEAEVEGAA